MLYSDFINSNLQSDLSRRVLSDEKTINARTLKNALKSVRAANKGVKQRDRIEFVCVNHYNRGYIYIPVVYIANALECAKYSTDPAYFIDDEYLVMTDGTFRAQWPIYLYLPNGTRFYQYAN